MSFNGNTEMTQQGRSFSFVPKFVHDRLELSPENQIATADDSVLIGRYLEALLYVYWSIVIQ